MVVGCFGLRLPFWPPVGKSHFLELAALDFGLSTSTQDGDEVTERDLFHGSIQANERAEHKRGGRLRREQDKLAVANHAS